MSHTWSQGHHTFPHVTHIVICHDEGPVIPHDAISINRVFIPLNNVCAGIITPSTSVLSAVGGLTVLLPGCTAQASSPSISVLSAVGGLTNIPGAAGARVNQQLIVGVSYAILFLLFALQVGG